MVRIGPCCAGLAYFAGLQKMAIEFDQFLRRRHVESITGFGKSWLYVAMAKNEFPMPIRIGTSVVWRASDVARWQEEKISQNQKFEDQI